jgi:hypothetical protein
MGERSFPNRPAADRLPAAAVELVTGVMVMVVDAISSRLRDLATQTFPGSPACAGSTLSNPSD